MNPAVWAALGVAVAAAITGAVTWHVARRKNSGSIATTEANVLWEQAKAFWDKRAEDLTAEIVTLRAEMVALRKEMVALRVDALAASEEIKVLRERLREAVGEAATTKEAVVVAEEKIAMLENGGT